MPRGIYKRIPFTEEHKRKIGLANSISHLGKKHSEETKRKMRKTKKARTGRRFSAISEEDRREKKREEDRKYARTTRKIRRKERRKIDYKYRLDSNMSSLISFSLRGAKAGRKWRELVGFSVKDLMEHLEKQFDSKMSWDNYGSYWWVDHIKPRSLFNYKFPEDKEFKECWSLNNLQPLEKIANIRKGNKF